MYDDSLSLYESIQSNIKSFLSIIVISNFLIIFLLKFSIKTREKFCAIMNIQNNSNIDKVVLKDALILIAHPDDEIMFFAPTIKTLLNNKCKIRILCLSNGNYEGNGKIREEEFKSVCKQLRIEEYEIVDDKNLQDNIKVSWEEKLVAQKLSEYLNKDNNIEKIGTIITFDERGVTKHPNHISCHDGLM
jgi:N-acetylglucosaminylphosphatidylinositol deacetylase